MTRINTNVSSLIAQKNLARSNDSLGLALTRLSTGLRINTGKDDPAGLIASEALRSDIISVERAITNSQRANQLIATADSALGQVSSLLNDIRGLVTEAANTGALSPEQIAANQLQIDSSLEAIDRISQITQFQGRRLLDGSLDFISSGAPSQVKNLQIDQANLGTAGSISVSVKIGSAATQALITNDGFAFTAGAAASGNLTFADVTTPGTESSGTLTFGTVATPGSAASGTLTFSDITTPAAQAAGTLTLANGAIDIEAVAGGAADGLAGNGLEIEIIDANSGDEAVYDALNNKITVTLDFAGGGGATLDDIVNLINNDLGAIFDATTTDGAEDVDAADEDSFLNVTSGGLDAVTADDEITITALNNGTGFNGAINVVTDAGAAPGSIVADFTAGVLTITLDNSSNYSLANIVSAIDTQLAGEFDASLTATAGDGDFLASTTAPTGTLAGGVDDILDENVVTITSLNTGTQFNGNIAVVTDAAATAGSITAAFAAGTLTITLDNASNYDINDIVDAINTQLVDDFEAELTTAAGSEVFLAGTDTDPTGTLAGGVNDITTDDVITITALNSGTAYNGTINVVTDAGAAAGSITAAFANGALTITLDNSSTYELADIVDALNTQLEGEFEAELSASASDSQFVAGADTDPTGALAGGTADTDGGLVASLVVNVSGKSGSEVFSFQAGTQLSEIVDAINLVTDATGVQASIEDEALSLSSTEYGSSAFVDVNVISEGAGGTFSAALSAVRTNGTDINATVNGVKATGEGNKLSINTSRLDLSLSVEAGSTTDFTFNVTGGGALFQLGPDIVSNQQARIAIQSVSTARLGGINGRLFELRSGGDAALATDTTRAAKIVEETIDAVTSLRGRLGAFQKTTLETNIYTLNETLANLTEAESTIRDADFAQESAALTRAQILVQSGTSVLGIANSNPQNALALLR